MKTQKTQHSPTPWGSQRTDGYIFEIGSDVTQTRIGVIEGENNAAHIVKCVNSHDVLVAACEACVDAWRDGKIFGRTIEGEMKRVELLAQLRAALAAANG